MSITMTADLSCALFQYIFHTNMISHQHWGISISSIINAIHTALAKMYERLSHNC